MTGEQEPKLSRMEEAMRAAALLFPDDDKALHAIMAQVYKPAKTRLREAWEFLNWEPPQPPRTG